MKEKLIYILGDGRSGSTIFSVLLGNHPDITSVGELYRWFEFEGCPKAGNEKEGDHLFWNRVRQLYFSNGGSSNWGELRKVQHEVEAYSEFIRLYLGLIKKSSLRMYESSAQSLFDAIREVSGNLTIVDSSRNMGRAFVLARKYPEQIKIIHLVRDPRGVMWSYHKQGIEQDYKAPFKSALHSLIKDILCSLVKMRLPRDQVLLVRYEDLMMETESELRRLQAFLGLSLEPVIEKIKGGEPFDVPYILDGNRIRSSSKVGLAFDDEWKRRLTRGQKMLATIMTLPFFLRFGYHRS